MRHYSTLFLAVLLLAGCGDSGGSDDSTSSGSGGTASGSGGGSSGGSSGSSGGSSGSGGSSSGGSSSGTGGRDSGSGGVRVRAAVSLHVVPSAGCSLGELTLDFPVIAAGHPVTATDKTGTIGDGETTADGDAASVVCTWLPATTTAAPAPSRPSK